MRHVLRLAACLVLAALLTAGCAAPEVKRWEAAEARVAKLEAQAATQPALDTDVIAAKAAAAAAKAAAEAAAQADPMSSLGQVMTGVSQVIPPPWGGLVGMTGAALAAWMAWRYRKLTITVAASQNGPASAAVQTRAAALAAAEAATAKLPALPASPSP